MIQLYRKGSDVKIIGTLERGVSTGVIDEDSLGVTVDGFDFDVFDFQNSDWETKRSWSGDRIFICADGEHVTESMIEPREDDGMSPRKFARRVFTFEILSVSQEMSKIGEREHNALRSHIEDWFRDGGGKVYAGLGHDHHGYHDINATEMAMRMASHQFSPADVNLTLLGQDILPEEGDPREDTYTFEAWQAEVANGDTKRGFEDWVAAKEEEAQHEHGK